VTDPTVDIPTVETCSEAVPAGALVAEASSKAARAPGVLESNAVDDAAAIPATSLVVREATVDAPTVDGACDDARERQHGKHRSSRSRSPRKPPEAGLNKSLPEVCQGAPAAEEGQEPPTFPELNENYTDYTLAALADTGAVDVNDDGKTQAGLPPPGWTPPSAAELQRQAVSRAEHLAATRAEGSDARSRSPLIQTIRRDTDVRISLTARITRQPGGCSLQASTAPVGINAWLTSLGLLDYLSAVDSCFDNVQQIVAIYKNSMQEFFDDMEISNPHHQQLFRDSLAGMT